MIAFDLMPHHQYSPNTCNHRRRPATAGPRRKGGLTGAWALLATFAGLGLTSAAMVHGAESTFF